MRPESVPPAPIGRQWPRAPTSADGDLEDIQLVVRGAPLAQDADWLSAIEQFGEGIFVHFDEAPIREWSSEMQRGVVTMS
jgi:hypothetical protein